MLGEGVPDVLLIFLVTGTMTLHSVRSLSFDFGLRTYVKPLPAGVFFERHEIFRV